MKQTKKYNPNPYNATHAALAFLLFWAGMLICSWIIYYIIKGIQDAGFVIDDLTPFLCMESVIIALMLAGVTLIVSKIAKANPLSGGGFLQRKGLGMEKFMTAVGVCGMAVLLMPLAEKFAWNFSVVKKVFFEQTSSGIDPEMLKNTGLLFLYAFVLVPVLPAIFEELLFRGVIMRGFSEWGKITGVVLSAAAFALAHGNTDQLVYQFLLGLAIGFLVMETKCLGVGMIAHFTNNFFVQVLSIVEAIPSEWELADVYISIIGIMSVLIAIVCFTAAFLYFGRRFLHSQKHGEKSCETVRAVFVDKDVVAGDVQETVVWHETGGFIREKGEVLLFTVSGNKRVLYNGKSKTKTALWLTAIAFTIAIIRIFLAFFKII